MHKPEKLSLPQATTEKTFTSLAKWVTVTSLAFGHMYAVLRCCWVRQSQKFRRPAKDFFR